MAIRIPLPGQGGEALQRGVESGTNMFANLLGHGVNLGRMHQRGDQFNRQLAQDWQKHIENAALRKMQEERLMQAMQQQAQMSPLNMELLRAKIEAQKAAAEKSRRDPSTSYKPTELERIVIAMSGGDPEVAKSMFADAAATRYGITMPGSDELPVGSQSFKSLPKNIQAQENADQIKMQTRVNDATKAYHDLDKMEEIINKNPDMARDFAYIIGNPEDKSFKANLARRYVDKKKLGEIEKFVKYSNDFVLAAGGGLGNNFTDAKLKALQLSKMHAGNTDVANRAIISNYRERLKPLINYGQKLKRARGKYTLPYFEDSYTDSALGMRPIEDLTDEELEGLEVE